MKKIRLAGFDHTQFNSLEDVEKFFAKFSLSKNARLIGDGLGYSFVGNGLEFISLYHPFTGVRSGQNSNSGKEEGFVGYIGLEGEDSIVEEAIEFIQNAASCGELSPNNRDFI